MKTSKLKTLRILIQIVENLQFNADWYLVRKIIKPEFYTTTETPQDIFVHYKYKVITYNSKV